jgi:membrane protease YdiL (CAAX protease family)
MASAKATPEANGPASPATGRRTPVFLAVTFAITWASWWTLAELVPSGTHLLADPLFGGLYILGGFGPTLAAYAAVLATPGEGSLADYHARLFRWRINPLWYLAALAVPTVLGVGRLWLGNLLGPGASPPTLQPLSVLPTLFLTMIVGGGLEELGWRGVAQPDLSTRFGLLRGTLVLGLVWALWHLPLFFIHGAPQSGGDAALFAMGVLGNAFLLAWVYAGTGSVMLCVLFHAGNNSATAMGLVTPAGAPLAGWIAAVITLGIGVGLLAVTPTASRGSPKSC